MSTAQNSTARPRVVALWLFTICALVFAMVVLGGVTRLTGSGLSMVRWQPVRGVLPPIGAEQWRVEFEHYQGSPEYQKVNRHMDVHDFKKIYWFEWAHRLLGRLIGLAFLLPFLVLLAKRMIPPGYGGRLFMMFVLGGAQGLLGWYMVKSGLVDNPHVSQYRLTAHLIAALLIYVYMMWVALGLWSPRTASGKSGPSRGAPLATAALVILTIVSGGFVAGLKAGLTFNTFPKMDDQWIPDGIAVLEPGVRNLFENIVTVQFDHRLLAMLTLVAVLVLAGHALRSRWVELRPAALLLGLAVVIQVALGIATLLMRVPVALGAAHQAGALLLLTAIVYFNHAVRRI